MKSSKKNNKRCLKIKPKFQSKKYLKKKRNNNLYNKKKIQKAKTN